ncbi:MAG: hypothetical protein II306_06535 [Clostridia bacterium]|nr:hypothetical protein [Clostridia bacterium]
MLVWKWGKALLNGYSNKFQKGYIDIEPDAGIPFRRMMFSDISDLVTATFCLTRTQYIEFMSWYRVELRQGTLPFQMFDCRYGVNRVARLIGDPPQFQPNSTRQNLSVTIAFEPSTIEEYRIFTVEDGKYLLVNDGKKLVVNYGFKL